MRMADIGSLSYGCVGVGERAREREGERGRGREWEKERGRESWGLKVGGRLCRIWIYVGVRGVCVCARARRARARLRVRACVPEVGRVVDRIPSP